MKRAICLKCGTDIDDGPSLRADHERGRGHVTQFQCFGTPLITFERIELSTSNLVYE